MEWSKSSISNKELEKKQREFMEQAIKMAERAGRTTAAAPKKSEAEPKLPAVYEPESESEVFEGITEELTEELSELSEEENDDLGVIPLDEEMAAEEPQAAEEAPKKPQNFGVFDTEQLMKAIENGEVSGDGLKQAAEILEEMSSKTAAMKKLLEEQEGRYASEEKAKSGTDYGLNGYIDRHNNRCRGCSNGNRNGNSSS